MIFPRGVQYSDGQIEVSFIPEADLHICVKYPEKYANPDPTASWGDKLNIPHFGYSRRAFRIMFGADIIAKEINLIQGEFKITPDEKKIFKVKKSGGKHFLAQVIWDTRFTPRAGAVPGSIKPIEVINQLPVYSSILNGGSMGTLYRLIVIPTDFKLGMGSSTEFEF